MAWDPYQQKKFVSRKYKFALDENFHLDKIRGEKKEKKKLTLNVWTTLIISIALLLIAFVVPGAAKAVIIRRHTDAMVETEKTRDAFFKFTDNYPDDYTLIVVEKGGKYYLFWYDSHASGLKKDGENVVSYGNLVEISSPEDGLTLPVNVAPGRSFEYPFTSNPVETKGDSAKLTDGLQLMSGCKIQPYHGINDEIEKFINAKRFTLSVYTVTPG